MFQTNKPIFISDGTNSFYSYAVINCLDGMNATVNKMKRVQGRDGDWKRVFKRLDTSIIAFFGAEAKLKREDARLK